jgi:transposase
MEKLIERRIAREAKKMTRYEIVLKATAGKLTWTQAAEVLGITPRHMRRLRTEYREHGIVAFHDNRGGRPRRKRIKEDTVEMICRLKSEVYDDFSVQHFYEKLTEEHGVQISYSWTMNILQEAGIVKKARGRGRYFRKRERRPMRGMMLHIDGSTHEWIPGLPMWDLIAVLDDADGKLLYAQFFEEEGTLSTFAALQHVLKKNGRFSELYHDRGSHFGRTSKAGQRPDDDQNGQVTRALKALGIKQIFGNTPQARGRGERAFGTIQGRLPQELRLNGIKTYQDANVFLEKEFKRSFNRRFTVKPRLPEAAFVPLAGIDLSLLLSVQHERTVKNDNTVQFRGTTLQLPSTRARHHYARCPVLVHELTKGTLAVSYQGNLVAEYTTDGEVIKVNKPKRKKKSNRAA